MPWLLVAFGFWLLSKRTSAPAPAPAPDEYSFQVRQLNGAAWLALPGTMTAPLELASSFLHRILLERGLKQGRLLLRGRVVRELTL